VHAARHTETAPPPPAVARWLGRADYDATWRAMQRWVESHQAHSPDELWLLEHPPVFTLGQSARREHLLAPGEIPVVATDRGGQVTYHGPGQLVVYVLVDLNRLGLGVRALVTALEAAVIGLVADWGIRAHARREAPGVYVGAAKLASIGLRIRRGISYHGLALNVAMDLGPFSRINPCGQAGLETVDLKRLGTETTVAATVQLLLPHLWRSLGLAGEPQLAM
jgi:lipoyl(octanoyl) transferase